MKGRESIQFFPTYKMQNKGFTLIELLIVIAIIAVLSVVVVLTLNPAELLRQARDSTRISDMSSLNSALSLYLADNPSAFALDHLNNRCMAATSSAAWAVPTLCSQLGFDTAGTVSVSSTNRNIDGTGWLRVDFRTLSTGAPFGTLPVDPVNTWDSASSSQSLVYFMKTGTSTTNFKLSAKMESTKFSTSTSGVQANTKDGGTRDERYEVGNDLSL